MKTIPIGSIIVLLAECRIAGEHREVNDEVKVGDHLSEQEALYMVNGRRAKVKEEAPEEDGTDDDKPLKDRTVAELKVVAEGLGVEGFASMTKPKLLEAIEAAQDKSEEDGTDDE